MGSACAQSSVKTRSTSRLLSADVLAARGGWCIGGSTGAVLGSQRSSGAEDLIDSATGRRFASEAGVHHRDQVPRLREFVGEIVMAAQLQRHLTQDKRGWTTQSIRRRVINVDSAAPDVRGLNDLLHNAYPVQPRPRVEWWSRTRSEPGQRPQRGRRRVLAVCQEPTRVFRAFERPTRKRSNRAGPSGSSNSRTRGGRGWAARSER
jgi:hypothetical protein